MSLAAIPALIGVPADPSPLIGQTRPPVVIHPLRTIIGEMTLV
jgi:hypothetical protein